MGDEPKTTPKTDLSPGMLEALSGAGKLDKEQSQKFLDLVMEGYNPATGSFSITGKALPMYVRREVNTENDGDDTFEVEYQVGDNPSVKISGTLEEIRAQLTKTD